MRDLEKRSNINFYGSCRATNPSKLELEFFYNNLVEPGNSTFGLIQKFDFNDKSNIQLVCKDQKVLVEVIFTPIVSFDCEICPMRVLCFF